MNSEHSNNLTKCTKFLTVALLAVNISSTTLSTSQYALDSDKYLVKEYVKVGETSTPHAKEVKLNEKGTYDRAKDIIGGEIRGFTKAESEAYYKAMNEIYKPIGVNVFDIC